MDSRTGLPTVGMVGGGQLARMTHQAAIALGQSLRVLAVSAEDGAALVAADTVIGHHSDLEALRGFAKQCDVVTFDHEHVPTEHIQALVAAGVTVYPSAEALRYAQDKRAMREKLSSLGVPVPAWRPVASVADVAAFAQHHAGSPSGAAGPPSGAAGAVVLKASTGGYDGRGVWVIQDSAEAQALLSQHFDLIVEEHMAVRRELAAVVARSPWGQVAAYPVVQTVQRDGICVEVLAPAPGLTDEAAVAAQQLAIRIAVDLDVVGILAVELFELAGEALVVNELAMRPHNSAHWTIDGARTSQFEQHLRAVLDYPLGQANLTAPAIAMANVIATVQSGPSAMSSIDERLHHVFALDPAARVHLYGKQPRPGRKIGHVTVVGEEMSRVRARAVRAARLLSEGRHE
jgi:5-(carboxyamino)imidazole ribonucleotide synthase